NRINIIYLSKYAAGKWNPIATEFTGSKEGKNTYRAKIDEHSYYAIFGKDVLGEIQVLSQTGNILSKSTNNLMLMLLLAAIILIIYWKRS
ncbi:MAG: hypothetical protein KKE71_06640, partial [Nanoarchaeota archaeon]|nr:hypothetical protein [Nanoarchaeota archaeon]